MIHFPRWKVILILAVCGLALSTRHRTSSAERRSRKWEEALPGWLQFVR